MWFDQFESTALAPGAVLELFEMIDAHRVRPDRPTTQRSRCPACNEPLQLTHDVQRSTRLTYLRCAHGHGRFTTFYQFLREKNFVRSLTRGEIERLKAHVQQVKCSSCGGPVSLASETECSYCRAPISIIDADAVKKTLSELGEAERRRQVTEVDVDPMTIMEAMLAGQAVERRVNIESARPSGAGLRRQLRAISDRHRDASMPDLVDEALHALLAKL